MSATNPRNGLAAATPTTPPAILAITVGLPGSGKTTLARRWVAHDPTSRARVNRDDLRQMLHGVGAHGEQWQEDQVTAAQHAAVAALLAAGISVVVDDTNLLPEHRQPLADLATAAGVEMRVWDLRGVPVEECIRRDARRPAAQRVGADVIRHLAELPSTPPVAG